MSGFYNCLNGTASYLCDQETNPAIPRQDPGQNPWSVGGVI